jgi:hypothetical protein
MAKIPANTKTQLKNPEAKFNRSLDDERVINQGILALATKAVGNAINDHESYTIRINFQNGRIVGDEAQPRLSVELLNGRSATSQIGVKSNSSVFFLELKSLEMENFNPIVNGDSWVARVKMDGDTVKSVFVNHDFVEEDRELIEKALLRGFAPQVGM